MAPFIELDPAIRTRRDLNCDEIVVLNPRVKVTIVDDEQFMVEAPVGSTFFVGKCDLKTNHNLATLSAVYLQDGESSRVFSRQSVAADRRGRGRHIEFVEVK